MTGSYNSGGDSNGSSASNRSVGVQFMASPPSYTIAGSAGVSMTSGSVPDAFPLPRLISRYRQQLA